MAISGTKSVHPAMRPADAFPKDLEIWCERWSQAPSVRRKSRVR
jgi:hypothetical protein